MHAAFWAVVQVTALKEPMLMSCSILAMTCNYWQQLHSLVRLQYVVCLLPVVESCLWDSFAAAGDGPDGAYGMFYTGCGKCPPRHTAMLFYTLSRVFDIALVALLICITLVEMRQRRQEVQQARRDAFAKLGSASKAASAGVTAAATAVQQQQRQSSLQPPPMQQMQSPSSSVTAAHNSNGMHSARHAGTTSPAAAAAGGSAATSPDSAAHAMWVSGTTGGVADDEDAPLPPISAARDAQTQQQQQQQSAPSLTPSGTSQLPAASSAGDAHHAATGHTVPHALHSPAASSLGAFANAQGPLESISPSSSSGHAALHGHTPAAAAAAAAAATSPTAGGAAATVGASSKGHSSKSKRPLKRGPLFARELPPAKAAGGHGSRHVVINYSPASLTIGELFEVGSVAAGHAYCLCLSVLRSFQMVSYILPLVQAGDKG
jgi:hypothetical protein